MRREFVVCPDIYFLKMPGKLRWTFLLLTTICVLFHVSKNLVDATDSLHDRLRSHPVHFSNFDEEQVGDYVDPLISEDDNRRLQFGLLNADVINSLRIDPGEIEVKSLPPNTSQCSDLIIRRFFNVDVDNMIMKRHAVIIRNITVKECVHEFAGNNVPCSLFKEYPALMKIQVLSGLVTDEMRKLRKESPLETSEVSVGVILNRLMERLNPNVVPFTGSTERKTQASKYVGFVRTLDFMYCSLDPVFALMKSALPFRANNLESERREEKAHIMRSKVQKYRGISNQIYIILEQLSGSTAGLNLFMFKKEHGRASEKTDRYRRLLNNLRTMPEKFDYDYDHLKSFLIQVLSTLWYASEVDFTHRDLHMDNIVATHLPQSGVNEELHFDFVPVENEDYEDSLSERSIASINADKGVGNLFDFENGINFPSRGSDRRAYTTGYARNRHTESSSNWNMARNNPSSFAYTEYVPRTSTEATGIPVLSQLQGFVGFVFRKAGASGSLTDNFDRNSNKYADYSFEEDISPHESQERAETPLLGFRVPASASNHMLYKIIDFGRSSAADNGKVYYAMASTYQPFTDLRLLAYEIIRKLPASILRRRVRQSSSMRSNPDTLKKEQEEYRNLEAILKIMLGWSDMEKIGLDQHILNSSVQELGMEKSVFQEFGWLPPLHFSFRLEHEQELSKTSRILMKEWIYNDRFASESAVHETKRKFQTVIYEILRSDFFKKFKVEGE